MTEIRALWLASFINYIATGTKSSTVTVQSSESLTLRGESSRYGSSICYDTHEILNQLEPELALLPISAETHGKTRIRPLASYAFAANQPLVPICASEAFAFCQEIPVVFVPAGESFSLAVLTGLTSGRNILIDESGRWHGPRVPALWQRGPFRLARIEGDESDRLALCLDDSSGQISESDGQPLFDESGAPAEILKDATSKLTKFEADLRQTNEVCRVLKDMGLLTPWPIEIEQPTGEKTKLQGLFRVDEPKVADLTGDQLVTLRNVGGLAMIYAQLLSLSKVHILARITQQLTARDQQRDAVRANKVDLDRAFGIIEDDPFVF